MATASGEWTWNGTARRSGATPSAAAARARFSATASRRVTGADAAVQRGIDALGDPAEPGEEAVREARQP